VINLVTLFSDNDSLCFFEEYDLQGLTLISMSLTWEPYLTMGECDDNHICNSYGYFYDLVENLAKEYGLSGNISNCIYVTEHSGIILRL